MDKYKWDTTPEEFVDKYGLHTFKNKPWYSRLAARFIWFIIRRLGK